MSYEWLDKVVLITGAANGIGAGVTRLILEEGVKHIAILDIDETVGVAFQDELNNKHGAGKTKFYRVDVTSDEQLFAAFQSVVEGYGGIDVVVNNAGILNDSLNVYKKEIAINMTALVTSTLKAIELMRIDEGGKGGTVINISSTAALRQTYITPIYCGTKAAVLQFSCCIGQPYYTEKTGVRVFTMCFGPTATSIFSVEKLGSHEKSFMFETELANISLQKLESAAKGLVEAYRLAKSGSTWIATKDRPLRDMTDNVTRAFQILNEFNE